MSRRGILSYGAYLPYRRLDRSAIAPVAGKGGGRGTRTVASYDEDTTTMGVEAARLALRPLGDGRSDVGSLWFSTANPAYADRTNASAIHAALRLGEEVPAFDANGSVRSAVGALRAALNDTTPSLVVTADTVTGLPGSPDESGGGDAAAALLIGSDDDGALQAELIGAAAATDEFVDRWRAPGEAHARVWEERFGEDRYVDLGVQAWNRALASAGVDREAVDMVVVAGAHTRAASGMVKKLGLADQAGRARLAGSLLDHVGFTGAAHPALALAAALEQAGPDKIVALAVLADGADVLLWRTATVLAVSCPAWPLDGQRVAGGPVPYGTFLAWRGFLPVDPPRRPTPARPSAPAAGRSTSWKFGFVGSQAGDGEVHLPPDAADERPSAMADAIGTITTFTVDKLAYSPSPPVVFAVVDFDGGGRLPVELTDVDADEVGIGDRVEMTFRRLFTADGIHNYFWKARPVRRRPSAGTGQPEETGEPGDMGERS